MGEPENVGCSTLWEVYGE